MMQGMFRNPLADPGLVGVSSGAALAAVATIALGNGLAAPWAKTFGVYALPLSAFCGGVATTWVLVGIVSRQGQLATSTLLLAGIALGALSTALMGLIAFASDDRELRDLTLWMLGSLSGASWPKGSGDTALHAARGARSAPPHPRAQWPAAGRSGGVPSGNRCGAHEAPDRRHHRGRSRCRRCRCRHRGLRRHRRPAPRAHSGGPDHRVVLPASALLGGSLVLVADVIARMALRPAELPLGVVMAIIGAPVFLHMVVRRGIGGG